MSMLSTNRDLYVAISALIKERKDDRRTLEEYLRALLRLAEEHSGQPALDPAALLDLVTAAFTAEPAPFDPSWLGLTPEESASGYQAFRGVLIAQIVDLVEMGEDGTLANEHRYFGVDAPRGARWYNFDPRTYLECAMAGTIGGWEPDDDTGRELVPGEVAVLDEDGELVAVDPEELQEPPRPLPELSWELLTRFLHAGQAYE